MKRILLLVALGILVTITGVLLFVIFGGQEGDSGQNESNTTQVARVPELTLQGFQGEQAMLQNIQGPKVIATWASWSSLSHDHLLAMAEVQQEYQDQVAFVAINRADPLADAQQVTDKLGITDRLIFLLDPEDSFYREIAGTNIPEVLFVSSQGDVVHHQKSPMTPQAIRQRVAQIL